MSAVPHSTAAALDPLFRRQLEDRRQRLRRASRERASSAAGTQAAEVVRLLAEVDAALERLDQGAFGRCEVCREPVEPERLLSDPLSRICLDHLAPGELRALEHDLEMAGRVQAGLLPPRDLSFDGWEAHTRYLPLGPVSGDYYDLVRPRETGGLVLFGDVAGKGVAASLLMSHLHAIFRSLAGVVPALGDMVAQANRIFGNATTGGAYATLVCGRAGADGSLELVNAGHPAALLRGARGMESLAGTGLPLGLFGGGEFGSVRRQLQRGDVLLLYTDGVSEARGGRGDEFGAERVAAALARARGGSAEDVVDAVLADLERHRAGAPLTDDATVMALRRVE